MCRCPFQRVGRRNLLAVNRPRDQRILALVRNGNLLEQREIVRRAIRSERAIGASSLGKSDAWRQHATQGLVDRFSANAWKGKEAGGKCCLPIPMQLIDFQLTPA